MKHFIFLVILIIGCQKENTPSVKTEPAAAATSAGIATSVKLELTLVPKPAPNEYQIKIHWTTPDKEPAHWVLVRHSTSGEIYALPPAPKETREIRDHHNIVPGGNYTYYLKALESDEGHFFSKAEIRIPKDLVINKNVNLKQIKGYRRLFLKPEGKILSQNNNLEIDVFEIVGEGGTIQNFLENAEAPPGNAGRQGGVLWIRAAKATGQIKILANGEKGGKGLQGLPGVEGEKGKKGGTGLSLPRADEVKSVFEPPTYLCYFYPTAGGKGGPGGVGGKGGSGQDGGDSGSIYLEIENPNGFDVVDARVPGAGGSEGPGGEGGKGGPGGDPGDLDERKVCPPAERGKEGPRGPAGVIGEIGKSGKEKDKCFKLGTVTYGNCEPFLTQNWTEPNR